MEKGIKRHCFALDLINDGELIREYKEHHKRVWPEILESIEDGGIVEMEIYLVSNRLFMIIEVDDTFSFERKALLDLKNPKVKQWEELMWKYQKTLPVVRQGEKWLLMEKIFEL